MAKNSKMAWQRTGDMVTCGEYRLIRKQYERWWTVWWRDEKIGVAPMLYLAQDDADAHAAAQAGKDVQR